MKKLIYLLTLILSLSAMAQGKPKLDGAVIIPQGAPALPVAGQLWVSSSDNHLYQYDGSQWLDLTDGAGAILDGSNTTSFFEVKTSPLNGIEVGTTGIWGGLEYVRINGGETSGESPILYITDNRVSLSNYTIDDVNSVGANSVLTKGAGDVLYGGGSGDVTAASAFGTDNRLLRSDGTGKGVQASNIEIDDSDNVSGMAVDAGSNTITNIGSPEIADGSMDETDMDASINASLDKADNSVQLAATNITNGGWQIKTNNGESGYSINSSNAVTMQGGTTVGSAVSLTMLNGRAYFNGYSNAEIDAEGDDSAVTAGWVLEKLGLSANSNNIVRTFYTTEDVTTTVANQEVQSGGDIGSKVINTISGATTATAELTNTSATKIDVYSFDVLDAGGQWDITCTNGFVADGFTGDTVRLDGIGSVDFVETGVNTGIFQVTPGANVSYVTTASLIVPSLDNANTVAYIDAREFAASSNGASVSPTDQSGNGTTFTSTAITKQTDADSDPTFAVNGSSSRISLSNNFNFQTGVAQSIGIFISADGMGTGARFSKRDDSSGGSNDHFAIYNGYYYMGGNEGNPSFSSDSNVLITLTKTTGDVWYIYEDGTQRATGAWTNETSTADLLIGAQVNGGGFNDYATGEFEVFFITNDFITNTEAGTIANEINTR